MDKNLKIILSEFEKLKGQHVITESHIVERFIAIGTDEEDYYYITYNGRKFTWHTCVGRIIPLKGKIEDREYNCFISTAKLNHWDIVGEMCGKTYKWLGNTEEVKTRLITLTGNDKLLTEPCWDLN